MKISEYIKHMETIMSQVGDVEVQTVGVDGGRLTAPIPKVAYVKVLRGRENKPRFWETYEDDDRKGDPMCRV